MALLYALDCRLLASLSSRDSPPSSSLRAEDKQTMIINFLEIICMCGWQWTLRSVKQQGALGLAVLVQLTSGLVFPSGV